VLAFHARLARLDGAPRAIEAALDEVGLGGRAGDRVGTYSKGMQQRLGLAVALLGEPALIFLDEPTSALDPLGRSDVRALIERLRARGTTVFLNSHLLGEVERVCDRVCVVDRGRVLAQGTVDGLVGAARRGVRVRILVDDLYTASNDRLLQGIAAYPNVQVRLFNPFPAGRALTITRWGLSLADLARLNHRMHNKLFIADGVFAIAGGRNIADEYFLRAHDANFVDMDAFVMGAVVPQMSNIFDRYWNSEVVYPIED
ncbi:MAG: phospholipase D-like domain-containing protein, partial [Pseudomonadota bacterium]|nr:phospholipase D-like domain-containing protein [Pseudomonadota bacterium]